MSRGLGDTDIRFSEYPKVKNRMSIESHEKIFSKICFLIFLNCHEHNLLNKTFLVYKYYCIYHILKKFRNKMYMLTE